MSYSKRPGTESSKKNLLDALLSSNEAEVKEIPRPKKTFLEKIVNTQEEVVKSLSPNCNTL